MEGTRSPQETVALRDVAYVICFGHFPKEEEEEDTAAAARHQGTAGGAPLEPPPGPAAHDAPDSPSQSSASDDQNPFLDDQDPAPEDQSPIAPKEDAPGGDQTPSSEAGCSPSGANNGSAEDVNLTNVSQSSLGTSEQSLPDQRGQTPPANTPSTPEKDPGVSPLTPLTATPTPTPPPAPQPKAVVAAGGVSKAHAKEVIAEAFNVTRLDLRRLVEDIAINKKAPSVELVLEEMRTEGLAVEPTTGSSSPPTVFLRAVVGGESRFTSFSSISATRAIQNALTLVVRNMYTDTLLLQVWRAGSPAAEAQSGPVLDILGRLISNSIRHKKDKASSTSPRHKFENNATTTNGEVDQENLPEGDMGGDVDQTSVGQGDQVDHSDDTPIINTSLWEDRKNRPHGESPKDTKKTKETGGSKTTNAEEELLNGHEPDGQETSDDMSVSSGHSPQQMRTSTPRFRSASFQSLELSTVGEDAASVITEKNKKRKGSLRIKVTNLRASLHSTFKKGNQNGSVDTTGLEKNAADSHSVRSEDTDALSPPNPFDEEEELDKNNPFISDGSPMQESENVDVNLSVGKSKGNENNKLDRERSKSSLSIASLSKLNLSFHMSIHKATDILKRVGSKKGKKAYSETSTPELPRQQLLDDNTSVASFQTDNPPDGDQVDASYASNSHSINGDSLEPLCCKDTLPGTPVVTSYARKSFRSKFSTPRPLRAFKSLRDKGNTREQIDTKDSGNEGCNTDRCSSEGSGSPETPQNPNEVQSYLSSIGKGHLKAELLAHVSIPIKTLVGTWEKEDSFPLTAICDRDENSNPNLKKKKLNKASGGSGSKMNETSGKLECKLHIRLTLPTPETELTSSSYDTYSAMLSKLVDMQVQALDSVRDYKGAVGAIGNVLLQQLVFFSRVSEPHRTLATWLVLVKVKPLDSGLLLPLLQAIRSHLEAGLYLTTQKHQLASSLSCWVQKVLKDEFEMLHSSFPSNSELLELQRLENYLRCFNAVETCYELRVLFEREMMPEELTTITDLLQDALCKHIMTWVEALNKEPLKHGSNTSLNTNLASPEWQEWQKAHRRASLLTKPILDFLTISFHTYQTIFMLELSVNYMYLVMPKMLAAALHLLNPLVDFDVVGISQIPSEAIPTTSHVSWVLCSNLSQINQIGIEIRFPQHLIPQEYRDAFSTILLHWLALSKHLALEEFDSDIQKDEFVAVDDLEGYSQSAVGATDLLKALMRRLTEVRWPGGVGPGKKTLEKIGKQVLELAAEYTNKVTHAYSTHGGYTDRISMEVCVVVRNVEHVCDEVRKHLLCLAGLAEVEDVAQHLHEETRHLQEHLDYAAEYLLQRCLPRLEQILTKGISQGNSEFVVESLQVMMQPVEDRLYFAEPLLHQLWLRLFQHATSLMDNYIQGDYREGLRCLRRVLADIYDFLTDEEGVGLHLQEDITKEYDSVQAKLKILGATTPELVSQFYHERYQEQLREGPNAARALIVNVGFTEAGLRVYVVQGPGTQSGGVLVKVRVEPHQWFPTSEPRKTHLIKSDPAVFNETFEFPAVSEDHREGEQGGILTLQVRTPRLLGSSIVHYEAVLPLANVPRVSQANIHRIQHSRLPLTRPWTLTSYKPLEALRTRALDKTAVDFLKALSERWEPHESSVQIQESQKLRATFARAGSVRNSIKGARKPSLRNTTK